MKLALQMLGEGQAYAAQLWGISQAAVSKKAKGDSDITYEQAKALEREKGVSAEWLLSGEGSMYIQATNEPDVVYTTRLDVTEQAITQRFIGIVDQWQREHAGTIKKDIAEKIGIRDSHYSQLRSGAKALTVTMLANAVLNLDVDANQVLAMRSTSNNEGLLAENKKLKREIEGYIALIDKLELQLGLNEAREKKSA